MSVTAFQDLPLAERDHEWDGDAAEGRVREWADAGDGPNERYGGAHLRYDHDKKENFGVQERREGAHEQAFRAGSPAPRV